MKSILNYLIVAAAILVGAHSASARDHDRLWFTEVTKTMKLVDPDDSTTTVQVAFENSVKTNPTSGEKYYQYRATISFFDASGTKPKTVTKNYSMLSLGLQGIEWDTMITSFSQSPATGTIEVWKESDGPTSAKQIAKGKLAATGKITTGGVTMLNGGNVWLLKLTGVTSVEMGMSEANRPHFGHTTWVGGGTTGGGHDNTPPPVDPD